MSLPAPPSETDVRRFRTGLERLLGSAPAKLGIAVSGGADSLALLLLAHAAYPGHVAAATVDHGLRADSADEARCVEHVCAGLGVPHATLTVAVEQGGEGLQGEARRVRYQALSAWAEQRRIAAICTGHHEDDQAETILMRLKRGSGVGGLAGVRQLKQENAGLVVVRPLLGWSRTELRGIVDACGVSPAEDPSNADSRFDRVAMRAFLRSNPQFEAARLARSAAALGEADDALEWMTEVVEAERCACADIERRIDADGLPREVARRLLARAIAEMRREQAMQPAWTGSENVEGLLQALEAGGTATLAGIVGSAKGRLWRLRVAPPRRDSEKAAPERAAPD